MEFENNQPTDDEQRHLAETKKITLQPLHTGITPDPIPDAEIAARNTQETSPNMPNDTEDTKELRLMQPSKSALDKPVLGESVAPAAARSSLLILVAALLAAAGATAWLWMNAA